MKNLGNIFDQEEQLSKKKNKNLTTPKFLYWVTKWIMTLLTLWEIFRKEQIQGAGAEENNTFNFGYFVSLTGKLGVYVD
jgi:hypothetical protein